MQVSVSGLQVRRAAARGAAPGSRIPGRWPGTSTHPRVWRPNGPIFSSDRGSAPGWAAARSRCGGLKMPPFFRKGRVNLLGKDSRDELESLSTSTKQTDQPVDSRCRLGLAHYVKGGAMVLKFALLGAVVALIPGAAFILIPMELFMLYQIAGKHNAFEMAPFLGMSAALVTISVFLKGLATFLHLIPGLGQIANSLVAFGFISVVGTLAEQYYSNRATRSSSDGAPR
jgi:hypothetical protein